LITRILGRCNFPKDRMFDSNEEELVVEIQEIQEEQISVRFDFLEIKKHYKQEC
jgi:hypothetical protein